MAANANMAMSSFDRIAGQVLLGATRYQPLNNFRIQTLGGNIIQGQLNKIRVSEIFMNYSIPTILNETQAYQQVPGEFPNGRGVGNGIMAIQYQVYDFDSSGTVLTRSQAVCPISVPTGFYNGTELAEAITDQITSFETAQGYPRVTFCEYDETSNSIVWTNNTVYAAPSTDPTYYFVEMLVNGQAAGKSLLANYSEPDLLWTLGLQDAFALYPPLGAGNNGVPGGTGCVNLCPNDYPNTPLTVGAVSLPVFQPGYFYPAINGSYYTGLYTDYIDICSPTLCQAQYVRDGNTNQRSIHRDLIVRLYMTNETSTSVVQGRPFQIHRQFKNAKIMKWNADRSIDAIDIQMFDMFGNNLPFVTPYIGDPAINVLGLKGPEILQCGAGNMGITFLVDEHSE
jgi:hypothetical protein